MTSKEIMMAHVADVLQSNHGCIDYDTTAEYAALLLDAHYFLRVAADNYATETESRESFAFYVGQAVKFSNADGGFTQSGYLS